MAASRVSSSMISTCSAMLPAQPSGIRASLPPAAEAVVLHFLGELGALLGREHLGGIGERRREPLRRLVDLSDTFGPQLFHRGAIDRGGAKQLCKLLTGVAQV